MTIRLVRIGLFVLGLVVSSSAQNVRINGDLAREVIRERVRAFAITPDGTRVVYRAQSPTPPGTRLELFSRPLDRSGPSIPLNGPLFGVFEEEHPFFFAAGGRVVFDADDDGDHVFELYSAPADGSESRIQLSEPGGSVAFVALDPAGSRVVYKRFVGFSGYGRLHVVPVDGSAAPLTLVADSNGGKAWVTPDGTRVVYSIRDPIDPFGHEDLLVAPIDGSGAPLFLDATPSGVFGFYRTFEDLAFTPDGAQAVYHETLEVDGDFDSKLSSVPLDASRPAVQIPGYATDPSLNRFAMVGSSPPRLAFLSGGTVLSTNVDGSLPATLSPAGLSSISWPKAFGTEVVFSASSSEGETLFRAPGDGSQAATQLVPGDERIRGRFTLASPQTLAYIRGGTIASTGQACVVALAGGTPIELHSALPGAQGTRELIPHPDGQRILLLGDLDVAGVTDLYVAPLDASTPPLRLDEPRSLTSDVFGSPFPFSPLISPDGDQVIYWQQDAPRQDIFVVPVDGSSSPELLNEPRLGDSVVGDVTHFQLSRDGHLLFFRADQVEDEHHDLFVVSTGAPGTPLSLTAGQPSVQDAFALIEPGPRVVFRTASGLFVVQAVHASGRSTIQLDSSAGFADDVAGASVGRRLVYRKQIATGSFELWSVLLDGLAAPVRLHAAFSSSRSVTAFRVAADDTVVFRSDLIQDDVFELFAVAAKGGAPRRLNAPLVAQGDVQGFEIEPTGKSIAFLADAEVDGLDELFALPLDGGPPQRRSGTMPATGDVVEFAFAGDGRNLVYRADQVSDGRFDLFSTPILSSFGPAKGTTRRNRTGTTLLTVLPAGRRVQPDWRSTLDGSAVVYRANPAGVNELFRVPVDGSADPTRLSGALVAGGNVASFAITPERAVYLADQRFNERIEIFSVPLAGGAAVALDALPGFGDVLDFRIGPSSQEVVFRADRDTDQVLELFRAPIDGTTPALRVSGLLAPGGDVQPDFAALDELTVYRADQASDELFELFATR